MWYELWDGETGNRVGKYPTEEATLGAVLEDIRLYGRDSAATRPGASAGLLDRRRPRARGVGTRPNPYGRPIRDGYRAGP